MERGFRPLKHGHQSFETAVVPTLARRGWEAHSAPGGPDGAEHGQARHLVDGTCVLSHDQVGGQGYGIWKPVQRAWPRGFVEAQILIEQGRLEPETLHF